MRFIPTRRKPPRERTAAHQIVVPGVEETLDKLSTKTEEWQKKILRYARIVPEVMTGYAFVLNTLDMVTFDIERFDRTDNEWVPVDTPAIQGIERRLNLAFKAGRAAALGHLVEECYILAKKTPAYGFHFETLSPAEIQTKNKNVQRRVRVDGKIQWVDVDTSQPNGVTIIRVFTPDPDDSTIASGPHEPLIGLLETMALEVLSQRADAVSVLAGNGMLFIPSEILPDEVDPPGDADTPGTRTKFENELHDAMISPITDRGQASAVVPVTLYGPAEHGKEIRHIRLERESAADSGARMDKMILRYARSIDLPAQVITGIGEANHWGDWKVDENTWAYHLQPRAQRIANALYDGLIASILANLGLDPGEHRLAPNASKAIAQTDRSGTANEAYKLGAITPEAYGEAIGADPSDIRPDATEMLLDLAHASAPTAQANAAAPPDRTAAARTPSKVLARAARLANEHQARMEALYRRVMSKVAADAARDGKQAKRLAARADAAAAGSPVSFIDNDPSSYFRKYRAELEQATNRELFAFLRRVASLTGSSYTELRVVWESEFASRTGAVATQAERAAETIARSSFNTGSPSRILPNVVRALTSTANGGTSPTNGAAGNLAPPTHAGNDPMLTTELTDAAGSFVTQYTWVHGGAQHPFPAHEELDGRTWFSWEEFDALDASAAGDDWVGPVFYPGDHDGCTCEYSIDFVPRSEAT